MMPLTKSVSPVRSRMWCASSVIQASTLSTTASSASRWRRTTTTASGGITPSRAWPDLSRQIRYPNPNREIERRQLRAHHFRRPPRLAKVLGVLPGSGIDRHAGRQRRPPPSAPSGLHRPDQIYRAGCDRRRHRQSEKGDAGSRRRARLPLFDRARQLRAQRGHALQQPGGIRLRCRRSDARGI
jgi:hypothetical protein